MKITKYRHNFSKVKLMQEMDKEELLSTALQLSAKNEKLIKDNGSMTIDLVKYAAFVTELYDMSVGFQKLNIFKKILRALSIAKKITQFVIDMNPQKTEA